MTKVCRLCLQRLARGAKYFNVNAVESFTGFMPYRDQLTTCIPEMALDLIPNPVVCNSCRTALKSAYDFKTRCLLVEKKIRAYIEQQPHDGSVAYDLSEIFISDLPPMNKMHILQKELEQDGVLENGDGCQLLMQLQNEGSIPITDEVEITNVTKKRKIRMRESAHYCFKCWKKFEDVGELIAHKSEHSEDFVCNFCNQPFRSLQYLRRHNSICSKGNNKSVSTNILTKRPHLPTKAKNHLKRWLFRHTDHPYPTDLEKQMLMQETNLSLLQVENWFINARRRILQDLTKLKKHGIRCEDVSDNTLGLQLDLEEMVTPPEEILMVHSPVAGDKEPENHPDHPEDIEEAIEAIAIIKPDNSLKSEQKNLYPQMDDPIDISIIKTEVEEDRNCRHNSM